MRLLILLLILLATLPSNIFSQTDDYYFYQGRKINIEINNEMFYVLLSDTTSISDFFQSTDYRIETNKSGVHKHKNQERYWRIVKVSTKVNGEVQPDRIRRWLNENPAIELISPVVGKEHPVAVSEYFYVMLKAKGDYSKLEKVAKETSCEIISSVKHMPLWYKLKVPYSTNSINAANNFYSTGYFQEVDPGFMLEFTSSCIGDNGFNNQWGLHNSSVFGIDACKAWEITKGSPSIKVAIVDTGIDHQHNEFSTNLLSVSFDALIGIQSLPGIVYNYHGTHVAGIVGANQNNSQVSGVAPLTSLIEVSHPLEFTNSMSEELASAINWAWQNGADVINNSWGDKGGRYYSQTYSALLEKSIDDALTYGRNGLGSVVVFVSGNNAPTLDYPGKYRAEIICVGSIDNTGQKSSFSAFGTSLDVVAPGGNILSTKLNNQVGYESGTSMAAPHVSGIAALILSINPNLTQNQVRNAIELSCDKLPGYTYQYESGRFNGMWNSQVGYGKVNAYKALFEAVKIGTILSGPNMVCNTNTTFSINCPPTVSISWSKSANLSYINGQSSPSYAVKPISASTASPGWVQATILFPDCEPLVYRNLVWVGKPNFTLIGESVLAPKSPGIVLVNDINGEVIAPGSTTDSRITSINWTYSGPLDYINGDPQKAYFRASSNGGYGSIYALATNQCGSLEKRFDFEVMDFLFRTYPNPANDYVNIEIIDEEFCVESSEPALLNVYNDRASHILNSKLYDKTHRINVSSYPKGLYLLQIRYKGKTHNKHILIDR